MRRWQTQLTDLIAPSVARSKVTDHVVIASGALAQVGPVAAQVTQSRTALVMGDTAGFAAAGEGAKASLEAAGFVVETLVLPSDPLPKASVEEAAPFLAALTADPRLFPVSVGSGVINDLVKWAAFQVDRPYLTVATAASMDGYTSAGSPLAEGGFKVTIPTRAPVALIADLDVIAAAPAEMNGWGYGDLAGKVPAGGDWLLADALGVEPLDPQPWSLVQDHLQFWLSDPGGISNGNSDAVARLFVGLTAVGFAMEFHGSSRPASGADHQIAHMWEMEGHSHQGRKVSHGAAVAVGCVATLALYDWLIAQPLATLDIEGRLINAPALPAREAALRAAIPDARIAEKALIELRAKHVTPLALGTRLSRLTRQWPDLQTRLETHLIRAPQMAQMLSEAGAPAYAHQIGISPDHLLRSMHAASFIRRRYTIFDLLHETGLMMRACEAVLPKLVAPSRRAAV